MNDKVGKILRIGIVIITSVLIFATINYTVPLVYPFIVGLFIALIIDPVVRIMEKKLRLPRWIGVSLTLLVLLSIFFSVIIFLIAEIVIELTNLADYLPTWFNNIGEFFISQFTQENTYLRRIVELVQNFMEKNPQSQQHITKSIEENINLIANKGTQTISNIISGIATFMGNLPYYLTVVIFVTLAAFFIGLDLPKLRSKLYNTTSERIKSTIGLVIKDLKKALVGFVRAQGILISISSTIMLIGLLILGVPYAFTIALIILVVDLLPYIGVGAVLIPWIVYQFIVDDVRLGVGLSIIYGIIVVVRQLLEPKLVSTNVGLSPLLTLISLFVGLKLFGFLGLILGPVIVVILQALNRAHVFQDIGNFIKGKEKV